MNLNEFTTKELKLLSDMLQMRIDSKKRIKDTSSIRSEYHQNDIDLFELMRVKVNNALGKFK